MNAVIQIKPGEFNEDLFRRIKELIESRENLQVTISITSDADEKLLSALRNVEAKQNLTYFSLDEYEELKKQLLNEPEQNNF